MQALEKMDLSWQGLAVIDLQNRHLKTLASWSEKFTPSAVQQALLGHNDLISIQELDRFKEMRRIIANNNYISRVRFSLDRLETLDLSNNALMSVPPLQSLPRLKVLNLQSNHIREPDVEHGYNLEKLFMAQNEIDFPSRGRLLIWASYLKKMDKLAQISLFDNPFVEEHSTYKTTVFQASKSLQIVDGEERRNVLKRVQQDDVEDQEKDGIDMDGEDLAYQQTKLERQVARKLVGVTDLESVFNMLLHSVEMINYDHNHALDQMHELSNFIDQFSTFYRQQTRVRLGDPIRCTALVQSFLQNVQLIVDEIAEIRSPVLYNLCKLAEISQCNFGVKCLELIGDFLHGANKNLRITCENLLREQVLPNLDDPLDEVAQPVLEGMGRLIAENPDIREMVNKCFDRFKEWLYEIDGWIQEQKQDFDLAKKQRMLSLSALRMISKALKENVKNVQEFEDLGMMDIISQILGHQQGKKFGEEREIEVLKIIHECCRTKPRTAEYFFKSGKLLILTRPIVDMSRDRRKLVGEPTPEEEDDQEYEDQRTLMASYFAHYIQALSVLLVDQETIVEIMKSKFSPVSSLMQQLIHPVENALVLTSICKMAIKMMQNPAFQQRLGYVEQFIEWIDNGLGLLQLLESDGIRALGKREGHGDLQIHQVHDPGLQALITESIGVIGVISELGPSIDPFEKASQALNVSYRETILFALLAIPSDDVKLAVVRSLYSVRLDEFDKQEINNLVELIKTYKNVGAGQTEQVLSYIFYILGKLAYAFVKKNMQTFQRPKIQSTFFECLDILLRNQRRNVSHSYEEGQEKMTLSLSCVYFLQCASRVMNIAWKANDHVEHLFVCVLRAEEQYPTQDFPQAVEIEHTWMGRHLRLLLKALTEGLHPFTRVSLRLIQRIADLLENKPQKRLRDPLDDPQFHERLFDDASRAEKSRNTKEATVWPEVIKTPELPKGLQDSDAFMAWTQQHRTFVDYGIDLLLMFLEGRIRQGQDIAKSIKTQTVEQAFVQIFSQKVQNYIEQAKQIYEQSRKEDKEQFTRVRRVQIPPAELVRQSMRSTLIDSTQIQTVVWEEGLERRAVKHKEKKESDQYVLSVAAMLRCFYAALEKAPGPGTHDTAVKLLQKQYIIKGITKLCKRTGWLQAYTGVKFLRVVQHLLIPPAEAGVNRLPMLNLLQTLCFSISQILQKIKGLLIKELQSNTTRSPENRNFLYDACRITAVLVSEATAFLHVDTPAARRGECEAVEPGVNALVTRFVLEQLFSVDQIEVLLEIAIQAAGRAYQDNEQSMSRSVMEEDEEVEAKRSEQLMDEKTRFFVGQILGEFMDKSPDFKQRILRRVMQKSVFEKKKVRKSFLQQLLDLQRNLRLKASIHIWLHRPKARLVFIPAYSEKLHCAVYADVAPLNSNSYVKRIVAVSNVGVYILKPSTDPCPFEGFSDFCKSQPAIVDKFKFEDIQEVINFARFEQQLVIKVQSKKEKDKDKFYFLRFPDLFTCSQITDVLDRLELPFDTYSDDILPQALKYKCKSPFLAAYYVSVPDSGLGLFSFLKSPSLFKNCTLAVLTSEHLFLFALDWEKWLYLGFRQTINAQNENRRANAPDENVSLSQDTRTAWEIAVQRRKQRSIENTLKLKHKLTLTESKFYVQTTSEPLQRGEGESSWPVLRFGCDFGRQQFLADVHRALSMPAEQY